MIKQAILFALEAHDGTFRKGTNLPYILHPLEPTTLCKGSICSGNNPPCKRFFANAI
ncbi:MAG: hypothetical protein IKF49_10190 [Clostridia bacterium]|nr:hypothetical protein [Clostridia bacterium]